MINIDRIKKFILFAFILVVPMAYGSNVESRVLQENVYQLFGIVLIALFIGDIWISLFVILNVALFIYNGGEVGFSQVLNVFFGSIIFMISRAWFVKNKFSDLSKVILFIVTINLTFIILQKLRLDPLYIPLTGSGELLGGANTDYSGVFLFKAASGMFSVIAFPILASISIWLLPIVLYPIFLSSSTSVLLAFSVVTVFYFYYLNKDRFFKLIIPILAVILIMAGLFVWFYFPKSKDDKKLSSRLPLWHAVLKKSLLNPIGYGPDSFRNINKHKQFLFYGDYDYNLMIGHVEGQNTLLSYYSPTSDSAKVDLMNKEIAEKGPKNGTISFWDTPHSEYLKILFEYGFFGIFIFFGFIRELFLRFKYSLKDKELITITSCLLVYFVTGLTHFPLELARIAFFFPIITGAYFAKTDRTYQPS